MLLTLDWYGNQNVAWLARNFRFLCPPRNGWSKRSEVRRAGQIAYTVLYRIVIGLKYVLAGDYGRQPAIGDAFVRWVHDNRGRADLVHTIPLTIEPNPPYDFVEFPDHEDLVELDPSDRKFVAVANAHKDKPRIIEATDSKWWGWKDALEECGITVEFLCPDQVEEVYRRKMG